jgi:hypothetical protein
MNAERCGTLLVLQFGRQARPAAQLSAPRWDPSGGAPALLSQRYASGAVAGTPIASPIPLARVGICAPKHEERRTRPYPSARS